MFGLGFQELLIILVIALIIFGPSRLPQIGGSLGKAMRSLKKGLEAEGPEELTQRDKPHNGEEKGPAKDNDERK